TTGWGGIDAWKTQAIAGIKAAQAQGQYPQGIAANTLLNYILVGVAKGYPDEAIIAALTEQPPAEGEARRLQTTQIPDSDYYDNAQPNYSYDPKDQAVIHRHTAKWGSILGHYFHSPSHQRLEKDEG